MAIPISTGSGATLASELLGGAHYSMTKVVDGTTGSNIPWSIISNASGNPALIDTIRPIGVNQSGTWNVGINSGANFIGLVSLASVNGNVNVVNSGLVSNASNAATLIDSMVLGQYGGDAKGSLASGSFHPIQLDNFGNVKLGTGGNWIGLVSTASINGKVDANITNSSIPVTQSGTWNNTTFPQQWNGASFEAIVGNGANGLDVDVTRLPSLPTGTNFIGLVSTASINGNVGIVGTVPVSGTFWQSTQPVSFNQLVSLASGTLVGLNPSSNFIGLVSTASINGNVGIVGTVPVSGTFWQTTQPVSFSQLVSLASGTLVGLNPSSNFIGLVSVASINGTVTNAAGTNFIGLVSTASINGTVTNAAGTNFIGLVSTASINGIVSLTPGTTGGWTPYMFASLSSLAQQVKASAGELGGYYIYNPNAAVTYIQMFDIANSSVSLGVRAPTLTFGIPATSGANLEFANGVNFATAIQIAATTTPNGSTGPTTPVPVNILYK